MELGAGGFANVVIKAGFDLMSSPSVTVPAYPVLGLKAPTLPDAEGVSRQPLPHVAPLGRDRRFLYPHLITATLGTRRSTI